jgi:hypothetical protein
MRRSALAAAGLLAVAAAAVVLAPPAGAQIGSLLFGKPGTRHVSADVAEVTARGNTMREKRSSLQMALIKAAKLAGKQNKPFIALLREKTGGWSMNGRHVGDETTIRFRMLAARETVQDEAGGPARLFEVAGLLETGR